MPIPPIETIKWFSLLLAAVLLTSFGTTFPNRLNQYRSPRPHNGVRLFNECLARSQLAFFNYFLAIAITAPLQNHPNTKMFLLPIAVMSAFFYMGSIAASVELDVRLREFHGCPVQGTSAGACAHTVGIWEFTKMSYRYVFSTLLLTILAIYFAFVAGS